MERAVSDLNISSNIPLPPPALMQHEIPRTESGGQTVSRFRRDIHRILHHRDPRCLLIVGPCSIHDTRAGHEYAVRLFELVPEVHEQIYLVMRCYFEKPRTSVGWKGLIMDPHLDGSHDIPKGLRMARRFLHEIIEMGLPTATEFLDPVTPQYLADLVCWSAIGARTTESQTHRQMASGLSMPVGFKNATSGSIDSAINAVKAAREPQTFLGISGDGIASAVSTRGNPDCHVVLRGGANGPNYSAEHIDTVERCLESAGLTKTVLVDCSHGNSGKDHRKQPGVFRELIDQRTGGTPSIIGAMLESNLEGGTQPFPHPNGPLTYGQSITDSCINWDTTKQTIKEAAEKLRLAEHRTT